MLFQSATTRYLRKRRMEANSEKPNVEKETGLAKIRRVTIIIAVCVLLIVLLMCAISPLQLSNPFQTPNQPPQPQVLSYESHASDDHYMFYVSLTNNGGDGWIEVTCKVSCGPLDPFPEEREETIDGTKIVYGNSTMLSWVVKGGNGSETWEQVLVDVGWIILTKGYSLYMRNKETTTVQIVLCSPPTVVATTNVFARAKEG